MPLQRRRPPTHISASSNLFCQELNRTSLLRVFIQRTFNEIFHVDPVRRQRRPAARQAHARYGEQCRPLRVKVGQALVCEIDAPSEKKKGS